MQKGFSTYQTKNGIRIFFQPALEDDQMVIQEEFPGSSIYAGESAYSRIVLQYAGFDAFVDFLQDRAMRRFEDYLENSIRAYYQGKFFLDTGYQIINRSYEQNNHYRLSRIS